MSYKIRKVRGKEEFKVYNTKTKEIKNTYNKKDEALEFLKSLVSLDEVHEEAAKKEIKQEVKDCVDGSCVIVKRPRKPRTKKTETPPQEKLN